MSTGEIRGPIRAASSTATQSLTMRAAEENNAQAQIDKEDMDRHRRGKSTDLSDRKTVDIYEDLSEVSVALLRGFLEGLMQKRDHVRDQRDQVSRQKPYAMQAYASAQKTVPGAPEAPVVAEDTEVLGVSRVDLAAEGLDQGEIRDILANLESLEAAGIHYISIEKSTSFLQGIREGINRALTPAE